MPFKNNEGIVSHVAYNLGYGLIGAQKSIAHHLSKGILYKDLQHFFTKQNKPHSMVETVRQVSIPLRRNSLFDKEGETFTALRKKGVYTLGELQSVGFYLRNGGITLELQDNDELAIVIDQDLHSLWLQIQELAGSCLENPSYNSIELNATWEVLFGVIMKYFQHHPQIGIMLVSSGFFTGIKEEFCNTHLVGYALSDQQIATAAIANFYVDRIYNIVNPTFSPQFEDAMCQILAQVNIPHHIVSTLNQGIRSKNEAIALIQVLLTDEKTKQAFLDDQITKSNAWLIKKSPVIHNAEKAVGQAKHEITRHVQSNIIFERFPRLSTIFLGPDDGTLKLLRRIVSNLLLAKSPDGTSFSMATWFPQADYYRAKNLRVKPDNNKIINFEPNSLSLEQIAEMLVSLLEVDAGKSPQQNWEQQQSVIIGNKKFILDFLSSHPEVPETIKQIFQQLQQPEVVARKILSRFGSEEDQDYLIVNRFFDRFSDFLVMVTDRYVIDFMRGLETELIHASKGLPERVKRIFSPRIVPTDFSNLSCEQIKDTLMSTLEIGEHRIQKLNNESVSGPSTLKDFQEKMEHLLLYDVYDMKFLRWQNFWDFWNTLGGAWDCICFARKSLFNANTIITH